MKKGVSVYINNGCGIDYTILKTILDNIQGKFILTLEDSDYTNDLFKDYNITKVFIKKGPTLGGHIPDGRTIGNKDRWELIISNYGGDRPPT